MPSPFGHALAGAAVAWVSEPTSTRTLERRPSTGALTAVCAVLAALPDADLLLPGAHRTFTHSIFAVIVVTIVAAGVTRWVTRKERHVGPVGQAGRVGRAAHVNAWRIALICGAAYGSHLLLDLLGDDPNLPSGIQLLWPSQRWFILPITIFPGTERRHIFSAASILINLKAFGVELIVMGPIAAAAAWYRRRA